MPEGTYELSQTAEGWLARITARGAGVLTIAVRSTGGRRSPCRSGVSCGLTGLLPRVCPPWTGSCAGPTPSTASRPTPWRKWVYLANLRDRNEVLFYRLLSEHIEEMLPIVYTPTVGLAIERFSHEFRRPRGGVYLSVDHPEEVETSLRNTGLGADDVDLLVATDSEGILGIGDQGVGGIEISVGKLSVYTAAAGIHPSRVLPVVLDTGTDNLALLNDEMYLGERHARVRDERYDQLIDAYVTAVQKLFPNAMLHWEDFGATNARRILDRYADECCTFNDDMQGTAAVVLAAAFSAVRAAGSRMRDQRVVIHGAGTAGLGIADMMRDQMVREGLPPGGGHPPVLGARPQRHPRRRPAGAPLRLPGAVRPPLVRGGRLGIAAETRPGLADVVRHVQPTMLIGTSTQAGAFTEADRARHGRTLPTADHHAAVQPHLQGRGTARGPGPAWTDGRALVATGSPFDAGRARRASPTGSRRRTTRSSSPASGWASRWPERPGSASG